MDKVQKKMTVSTLIVLCSLFSLHDTLAVQALVWLRMAQFRVIRFRTVWFGASYVNLR
jgi:hypothetical protein